MTTLSILCVAALLSVTACAQPADRPGTQPADLPAAQPATQPAASPEPAPGRSDEPGKNDAPQGLLVAMRAAAHPGFDRLVLEFGGDTPAECLVRFVDEVRTDPADRPVTLRGKVFALIVCDGATTDTSRVESDPDEARRYAGPRSIDPGLDVLDEVAIVGDFEAVLSFGVGLSRPSPPKMLALGSPARLVLDFPR